MEGYFHQTIKLVLMDTIGSKCVWKSSCGWSTNSVVSWESYSNFHMWTCVKNFRPESGVKFFIHEIGVNFQSGMFNLVPHVKFLICIHFKHVSGVNQVWNRLELMRIFCTGVVFHKPTLIFIHNLLTFLLVDCFLTKKIFFIFVKHEYALKMLFY